LFANATAFVFFHGAEFSVKTWVMAEISKNIVLVSEVVNKKV
jgi:hypothetical protein